MFLDEGAHRKAIIKIALIPLPALAILQFGVAWILLLVFFVISPVLLGAFEKNTPRIYRNRLWGLALNLVVLFFIFGFSPDVAIHTFLTDLMVADSIFSYQDMVHLQLYLFGGLLVMNEMNFLIRFLMYLLNLAPIGQQKNRLDISDQQYNTGRVIGMLERIFIYTFALGGQFTAIGFILTAKGVVRYRDFGDRGFAEYVLIGTLLSALLAMGTAMVIKIFL